MRRTFKRLTLFALALALLVPGFAWIEPGSARAAITSADFLKADGKFLRNQSGTGDIVTLRGTNLGGWLTFEDWMSPLGEFAMDRSQWSVSASDNNSDASLAIDGDDTTRWTSGTVQTSGQWFQVDLGTVSLFNRIYRRGRFCRPASGRIPEARRTTTRAATKWTCRGMVTIGARWLTAGAPVPSSK